MGQRPKNKADLRRPFDPKILASAKKIARAYQLVLSQKGGIWYGCGLEFPTAMGDGKTVTACVRSTRQALIVAVAVMLEEGQIPPEPANGVNRTEEVEVELTPEEKTRLEAKAQSQGFRGLSDFIRTSVLAER